MEESMSVNEIVSVGYAYENNMARIAAKEEEFSHTIDPILRMYNVAMNLTAARLNIIEDELLQEAELIYSAQQKLEILNSIIEK